MSLPGVKTKQGRTSVLLSVCRAVQTNLVKLWIWFSTGERNWQKFLLRQIPKFELLHLAYLSVASFHLFHMHNTELLEWRAGEGVSFGHYAMPHVPSPVASFSQKVHLLILCFILALPSDSIPAVWVLLFWLTQVHNSHQRFLCTSHYSDFC